jgi:hypothetical protein
MTVYKCIIAQAVATQGNKNIPLRNYAGELCRLAPSVVIIGGHFSDH